MARRERFSFTETIEHEADGEIFTLDCEAAVTPGSPQTRNYPGDPDELDSLECTAVGYELYAPNGRLVAEFRQGPIMEYVRMRWKQVAGQYEERLGENAIEYFHDIGWDDRD